MKRMFREEAILYVKSLDRLNDFFTNKFKVENIIGKSVIIHESANDYRTQPSGNSGRMLACGVIIS